MGSISILTPPDNTTIVSVSEIKDELGITGSAQDVLIGRAIISATGFVERLLGGSLLRARYRETFRSNFLNTKQLGVRPLVKVEAVSLDGEAQDLTDFAVADREAGILHSTIGFAAAGRSFGAAPAAWLSSQERRIDIDPNAWSVDFTGGWFVEADNMTDIAVSVDSTDNSFNSAALFATHLEAGDLIASGGFTDPANNGLMVAASATKSKIIVSAETTLVTEASATRSIYVDTMPAQVTEAVKLIAKASYQGRDRDRSVSSESVAGAVSISWRSGSDTGKAVEAEAMALLAHLMPRRASHYGVVRA